MSSGGKVRRVEADYSGEEDETERLLDAMNNLGIVVPLNLEALENHSEHKSMGTNNEALKSKTGTVNTGRVRRLGTDDGYEIEMINSTDDVSIIVASRKPESEQQSVKEKNNCHNATISIKGRAKNTYASLKNSRAVKARRVVEADAAGCEVEIDMASIKQGATNASLIDNAAAKTRRVEADGEEVEIDMVSCADVVAPHKCESEQWMEANPETEQQNFHEGVEVDVNNKTLSIKGGAKNTYASSPIGSGAVKPRRMEAGGDDDFEVQPQNDPASEPDSDPTDVPHSDPADVPHSDPADVPHSDPTDVPHSDPADVEASCHEGVEVDVNNKTLSIKGRAKNTYASPIDNGAIKTRRVEACDDEFKVENLTTDVPDSDTTDVPDSVPTDLLPHSENSK